MPVRAMSTSTPRRRAPRHAAERLLLLATLLVPGTAAAQDLDAAAKTCVDAYHASQELRIDQKLRAAREKATVCSQEACPAAVRSGCTKWLTELASSQPSLAVTARGADGADVSDVVVEVDGERVTDSLTGRPIEVDPGKHMIRFSHRGLVTTQEVVVTEGIKNRPIEVRFGDEAAAPTARAAEPASGPPLAPLVIGGVGLVSLGVFATLAAMGTSDIDDLRQDCAPACPTDDVDSAKQKILLGDVFLGVGAVAVGVSAVWLIAHYTSRDATRASTGAIRWSVAPLAGGGFASVSVAR